MLPSGFEHEFPYEKVSILFIKNIKQSNNQNDDINEPYEEMHIIICTRGNNFS